VMLVMTAKVICKVIRRIRAFFACIVVSFG
jgi:hypothetical protein